MKKLFIVLLMAVVVLLPSCESEEEKALRETREACVDIVETVADVLEDVGPDNGMSDSELDEIRTLVADFKEDVKNETTIDGIKNLADDTLEPLMFYAMFCVDEATFNDVYGNLASKYPELLGN